MIEVSLVGLEVIVLNDILLLVVVGAVILSKNPNKKSIKNEVKYRIPERWTKKFHKQDIISNDILQQSGIAQERGKVNVAAVLAQREQADFKREQSISDQISGAAQIANPILHHSLSSRSPV